MGHLLLDEQSDQIFATTDDIAESVRKIGGTTLRSIGQWRRRSVNWRQDGLILRKPDAEDRRKVRVRLTSTGHEVLHENSGRRRA
jgi:hypothetical protein